MLKICVSLYSRSSLFFFDEPFFKIVKSVHFVRDLMYSGFVSGGLGKTITQVVHLIQFQCNRVLCHNLCCVKQRLYFCDNFDVYSVRLLLFFCLL